jgi:hypothetical protein
VFDYFLLKTNSVLPLITENLLQGHTELYRSYPPQLNIPRPDHLLPSAAVEAKRARIDQAQPSSGSTEDEGHLVEEEAEREAGRDNSSRPAVELTEALPQVPQGRRVVRKRKAQEVESSRYWFAALMSCQILVFYMLTVSTCSLPASSPRTEPEEMGTVPSATAAVTIAVVETTPSADQTPPPATETP